MIKLKTFALALALIVFGGCERKKETFEEVLSRAKDVSNKSFEQVRSNASGMRFLRSVPDNKIAQYKVKAVSDTPSIDIRSHKQIDPSKIKEVTSLVGRFEGQGEPESQTVACESFSDPSPHDSSLFQTDYYTNETPALIEVASELGSADEIYDFVRSEIKNSLLFGATQSGNTLLKTKEGSVVDKANLLAGLLRARGIPAQFVQGEVYLSLPLAKRLFDSAHVSDIFLLFSQVYKKYFAEDSVYGADFYKVINGRKYFVIPHIWVRAFVDNEWKNFDPTHLRDALLPQRGKGLLPSSFQVNMGSWYFGADSDGNYIKPKTIIDFLLEGVTLNKSINFVNSQEEYSGEVRIDNVLTELSPCLRESFSGVENSDYEFRAEVSMLNSSNVEVLNINQPLAKLSETPSFINHSVGLYSEISNPASGSVRFNIGSQVLASFVATTGTEYTVKITTHFPEGFDNSDSTYTVAKKYFAGGVMQTNFYARPVTQSELIEGIEDLMNAVGTGAPSVTLMGGALHLAGQLFHFKLEQIYADLHVLRGIRALPIGQYATYTSEGAIVLTGQEEKDLGFLPTIPGIDAIPLGATLYGDYSDIGYDGLVENLASACSEFLAAGSDGEATIWEQLFGLRGYSAVRAFQLAGALKAQDPVTHDYEFIQGEEFDSTSSLHIYNRIENPSALNYQWSQIVNDYGSPGHFYWGPNKEVSDPETGAVILAYLVNGPTGIAAFDVLEPGHSFLKEVVGRDKKQKRRVNTEVEDEDNDNEAGPIESGINLAGGLPVGSFGGGAANYSEEVIDFDQGNLPGTGPGSGIAAISCNPVEFTTGLMWHNFNDFNLRGRTPNTGIFFQRTYYTLEQYQQTNSWVDLGDLGKGWVHNFDTRLLDGAKNATTQKLLMGPLSSSTTNILWITDQGNTILFEYNSGSGTYSPPTGFVGSLQVVGSTYVLTLKGNIKYTFKKDVSSNHNGRLLKIRDPHGEELILNYDGNGRLQSVTSPFAGDLLFVRDSNSKLVSLKSSKNNLSVSFEYSSGKLVASRDLDGNKTAYQYNASQAGTKAEGLLKSFADPLGRTISFDYYQNGKVFKEVGLGNAVQAYQYAPYLYQKFTRVMAPNGKTTEYRYDDSFRVILEVLPNSGRIQRKWTSEGNLQWERDAMGEKTQFTYDTRGNRTGINRPEDGVNFRQVAYNQVFDLPISATPIVGSATQFGLNSSTGDVVSMTQHLDGTALTSNYTYDAFGTRLSTQTGLNSFSDLSDSNGFLKYQFDSKNPQHLSYDSRGRLIERRGENGRILRYSYDNFDRILSVEDTHGPDLRNFYDVVGRLIKRQRIAGIAVHTATFQYDDRDRLISETNYAGEKTEYRYDIVGVGCQIQDKPTQITRADGKTTKFEYDFAGRKTKEILPDGTVVLYGHNLRGDLISILDSVGNLLQYEYDDNRRVIKILSQSAGWQQNIHGESKVGYMPEITMYQYDKNDRVTKIEQILNNEAFHDGKFATDIWYDDLGRIKTKFVTHKRGFTTIRTIDEIKYKYLNSLEPTLVSEIENKNLILKFSYETQPPYHMISFSQEPTVLGASLGLKKVEYKVTPSQNGPVALVTKDGEKLLEQDYDPAGRLLSSKGIFSGTANTVSFSYDDSGRRSNVNHSSGLVGNYGYDVVDRVTNITWSGVSPTVSEVVNYTSAGLIKQITREIGTFGYDYNEKDEISSISYSGSESLNSNYVNASLTHDVAGNILNYGNRTFQNFNNFVTQIGSSVFRPSSDGLGRFQHRFDGTNLHDFRYNPNGQLERFRIFNSSGILQKNVDYHYDGLERRIAKVVAVPGQDTTFITYSHFGAENSIFFGNLKKGVAEEQTMYVDGQSVDDHLFEISSDSGIKAYKKDHLGSVLNSAAIGGKSVYGLYGENLGTSVSTSTFLEPVTYGFTGREYDNETGFYYFRARYYDPTMGRFLTKDPLGPHEGGDINPYRYAANNPVNYTDPYGESPVLIGMAVGAFIGAMLTPTPTDTPMTTLDEAGRFAFGTAIGAGVGATAVIAPAVIAAPNANPYIRIGEGKFPEPYSQRISIGNTPGKKAEIGMSQSGRIDVKFGSMRTTIRPGSNNSCGGN